MITERVRASMREIAPAMAAPGATWAIVHGPRRTTVVDAAGPLAANTIFRIASITKPILGVLTLGLAEDGLFGLDDPVERWLPPFASRRVLREHGAALDDTVPAERPTTIRDLLQMGVGWGFDVEAAPGDPLQARIAQLEIGSGWLPPVVRPDRWVDLAATLPMAHQPGEGWLYQYSFDALAVLIERATRRNLDHVLRDRVFSRLDMVDTGYTVPITAVERVPANWFGNQRGRLVEASPGGDPRLMNMPVFRSGATGLLSTASDLAKFARMLLDEGRGPRGPVISRTAWSALRTDTLTPEAARQAALFIDTPTGWGLGVGIDREGRYPGSFAGRFGWDGGTGTSLWVDPEADVAAVVLTRQGFGATDAPRILEDFWLAVHADTP